MKAPDYLTERELETLLKTALQGRYGVRDALLISLGYHHCLRVSELLAWSCTHVTPCIVWKSPNSARPAIKSDD